MVAKTREIKAYAFSKMSERFDKKINKQKSILRHLFVGLII